jgi:uncharacterized protein YecE (DUF72 family)
MVDREHNNTHSLYIGPAGWSYRDWIGPVYPPGKRIDQLMLIARYFNCIELNSSFYRVPGGRLVESWLKRISTVPGFVFTIKVLQRFTHDRAADERGVKDFIRCFNPLIENGRIGSFLLQFPWSFKNTKESRAYLQRLGTWFAGQPVAVELRHGSWNESETVELLAGCRLAFCNIDQPQIGYSLPPTEHVTSGNTGYIRLHGRNRKNWFRSDAGRDARYDYLYNEEELQDWLKRARSILARVKNLFIITNNHYRGQALANAAQLRSMIEARKIDLPPRLVHAFDGLRGIAANVSAQGDLLDDG